MEIRPAMLEDWMRDHYLAAEIDIGSSGVQDYPFREVRILTGLDHESLDDIILRDSPCTGREDLRRAIAERWGTGDPATVTTTHGASEAIYAALTVILNQADRVIVVEPAYHSLASVPESLACVVQRWPLRADRGFRPDIDGLAILAELPTAAIIVNFPHNPTGVTLTEEELDRLIEIARRADAYLVWDSSFAELVYDRAALPDPVRRYRKTISIGTLSKCFGLPGLRFGWCMADPDVIRRITLLRDRMTLSLSPLVERIARDVVRRADAFVGSRLRQAATNREILREWADAQGERVALPVPQGGVTAFPRLPGHTDTRSLCAALSRRHRVLLVPGAAFGHPDRVRLGFGGPTADLVKGLEHLAAALRD